MSTSCVTDGAELPMTLDQEIASIPPEEQVKAFIDVIGHPDDVLELRVIPSNGGKPFQEWFYARDWQKLVRRARMWNSRAYNVYVGANPRREFGLSSDENIIIARTVFVDQDRANGFTSIDALLDLIAVKGLPEPSAVVNSGHGGWAYWRLAVAMTDLAAWRRLQERLAAYLGTDSTVTNPERIVRLPGFTNHKPPKALAWLHTVDTSRAYPVEMLAKVLPELPAATDVTRSRPLEATSDSHANLLRRARSYAAKYDGCAQGSPGSPGRNALIFNLSGRLASFVGEDGATLTEAEIMNLAGEVNRRCIPPLGEIEFEKTVRHGIKYSAKRELKPHSNPINRQLALRGREVSVHAA